MQNIQATFDRTEQRTANKRFAAMLARRCCNRQPIFSQHRPQGDLYKSSSE